MGHEGKCPFALHCREPASLIPMALQFTDFPAMEGLGTVTLLYYAATVRGLQEYSSP